MIFVLQIYTRFRLLEVCKVRKWYKYIVGQTFEQKLLRLLRNSLDNIRIMNTYKFRLLEVCKEKMVEIHHWSDLLLLMQYIYFEKR